MLTKTKTIETELSVDEKIALDSQLVFESFNRAYLSGDKSMAIAYAKVLMLQAMSMN